MKPVEFDSSAFEDLAWWIFVGCIRGAVTPVTKPSTPVRRNAPQREIRFWGFLRWVGGALRCSIGWVVGVGCRPRMHPTVEATTAGRRHRNLPKTKLLSVAAEIN